MNPIPRFGMLTLVSGNDKNAPYVKFSLQRHEPKLGVVWIDPQSDNPNGPKEITFHSPKLAQLETVLLDQYEALRPQLEANRNLPPEQWTQFMEPKQILLKEGLRRFLPDVLQELKTKPEAKIFARELTEWSQVVKRPFVDSVALVGRIDVQNVYNGFFFGPAQAGKLPNMTTKKGWASALWEGLKSLGRGVKAQA